MFSIVLDSSDASSYTKPSTGIFTFAVDLRAVLNADSFHKPYKLSFAMMSSTNTTLNTAFYNYSVGISAPGLVIGTLNKNNRSNIIGLLHILDRPVNSCIDTRIDDNPSVLVPDLPEIYNLTVTIYASGAAVATDINYTLILSFEDV